MRDSRKKINKDAIISWIIDGKTVKKSYCNHVLFLSSQPKASSLIFLILLVNDYPDLFSLLEENNRTILQLTMESKDSFESRQSN